MYQAVSRPPQFGQHQRRASSSAQQAAAPASPTLTACTNDTSQTTDFSTDGEPQIIITRHRLARSVDAYVNLLQHAAAYKAALSASSAAAAEFAASLMEASRVKGNTNAETMMAASGLHYMISSNNQILRRTIERSFEMPLADSLKAYIEMISIRQKEYESLLAIRTAAIRQTESNNMKAGKKKMRDLNSFRKALEKLQEQVRELEAVKRAHYHDVLEGERLVWNDIGSKVSLLLRSTLELADRLASKSTADPILEEILIAQPDPFDVYRLESEEERDVFTVLPPLGNSMNFGSHTKVQPTQQWPSAVNEEAAATTPATISSNLGAVVSSKRPLSVSDALGFGSSSSAHSGTSTSQHRASTSAAPLASASISVPTALLPLIAAPLVSADPPLIAPTSDTIDYDTRPVTPPSPSRQHHHLHHHLRDTSDSPPSSTSTSSDDVSPPTFREQRDRQKENDKKKESYDVPILLETEPDLDPMRGDWGEVATSRSRVGEGEYGSLGDEED